MPNNHEELKKKKCNLLINFPLFKLFIMKDLKVCLFLITQNRWVEKRKKNQITLYYLIPCSPPFRTGPESFKNTYVEV